MKPVAKGFSPLDHQLEIEAQRWSPQVRKQVVWLSGLSGGFEMAERILNEVGQIAISDTTVWREAQVWGKRFQAIEEAQRVAATALPSRKDIVPGEAMTRAKMGVAMDGAMVNIRKEGWKELKVGCVSDIEALPPRDARTEDELDRARSIHTTYVAHLDGLETFGELVWAEARRRDWPRAGDTIALGDGAPWIWNLVKDHFFDSRQLVDWYHATQHLWAVAYALKGEGSQEARQWFKPHETLLFQGHADQIALQLNHAVTDTPAQAETVRREAGYLHENHPRMQYLETREDGFPIGSGVVESGCKQFRARFVGTGMRWSRSGINRLIPIRAAIMGHRFDECWAAAFRHPPN